MKGHRYMRAYMAGVAVPTVLLPAIFAVFCVVRFGYNPDLPIERALVFPLALAPLLWGGWNMLYVGLGEGRRLPLGVHGALVPLFLVPLGLLAACGLGFRFPVGLSTSILMVVPLVMIVYYLMWKYVVGFLNELLDLG
jgi:hypothetical protein